MALHQIMGRSPRGGLPAVRMRVQRACPRVSCATVSTDDQNPVPRRGAPEVAGFDPVQEVNRSGARTDRQNPRLTPEVARTPDLAWRLDRLHSSLRHRQLAGSSKPTLRVRLDPARRTP